MYGFVFCTNKRAPELCENPSFFLLILWKRARFTALNRFATFYTRCSFLLNIMAAITAPCVIYCAHPHIWTAKECYTGRPVVNNFISAEYTARFMKQIKVIGLDAAYPPHCLCFFSARAAQINFWEEMRIKSKWPSYKVTICRRKAFGCSPMCKKRYALLWAVIRAMVTGFLLLIVSVSVKYTHKNLSFFFTRNLKRRTG